MNWSQLAIKNDPIGDAGLTGLVNHCGGLVVVGTKLYMAMEDFQGNSVYGALYIGVYNCSDLSFVAAYEITGLGSITDASGIGYNSTDGYLYINAFTGQGSNFVWKFDLTGNYIGRISLDGSIAGWQGLTFWNGYMYMSTSYPSNKILQYTTTGTRIATVYSTSEVVEMEGIANNGNYLIALAIGPAPNNFNNVYFLR